MGLMVEGWERWPRDGSDGRGMGREDLCMCGGHPSGGS